MQDIYDTWVEDFAIDGFRIDTMKHVNLEFWQQFLPHILETAHDAGKARFFAFGEVVEENSNPFLSRFTTAGRSQAVLDFPFQKQARDFACSRPTDRLRELFAQDDWFTDARLERLPAAHVPGQPRHGPRRHVRARRQPGRAGVRAARARQARARAHVLLARQPGRLLRRRAGLHGRRERPGRAAGHVPQPGLRVQQPRRRRDRPEQRPEPQRRRQERQHRLRRHAGRRQLRPPPPAVPHDRALARLRRAHPALADGAQQTRYSSREAGIFAFSRTDAGAQVEYLVALNNAATAKTAGSRRTRRGCASSASRASGPKRLRPRATAASSSPSTASRPSSTAHAHSSRQSAAAPAAALKVAPEVSGRPEVAAVLDGDGLLPGLLLPEHGGRHPESRSARTTTRPIASIRTCRPSRRATRSTCSPWSATTAATSRGPAGYDHRGRPPPGAPASPPCTTGAPTATTPTGACTCGATRSPTAWARTWDKPRAPTRTDDFGLVFEIPLADAAASVNYIIHKPLGDSGPARASRAATARSSRRSTGRSGWCGGSDDPHDRAIAATGRRRPRSRGRLRARR